MSKNNKVLIVVLLVFLMCCPISLLGSLKEAKAASWYVIPPTLPASELPTARGDAVTGDDIVNTGRYLLGRGFSYSSVGTCTGFVTRILSHLQIGLELVSRNNNYHYCYNDSNWDKPGQSIHNAAWGPADMIDQANKMVNNGTAEKIGVIPSNNPGVAQRLGIENGDILISATHVAIAYIDPTDNNKVKTFGAASDSLGIIASNFENTISGKEGDVHVYRIAETKKLGNLHIEKLDGHNQKLANVTFRITGPEGYDQTLVTNAQGRIELNELPVGEYTVTEEQVPNGLINAEEGRSSKVNVERDQTVTYTRVNQYQRGSSVIKKIDLYEGENPKGDATLQGATYKLYAKTDIYEGVTKIYSKDEVVATKATKANGYTDVVDKLPLGQYYWQEVDPSVGYNINNEKIEFEIKYNGQFAEFASETEFISKEEKIYGRGRVIKMDNTVDGSTDKNSAEGAILKLTLKSDPTQYYLATIDKDGVAEFIDTAFAAAHPEEEATIPYGIYELTEVQASTSGLHTYFHINPETVNINVDNEVEIRYVMDEPVKAYVKVVKTDSISGQAVKIAGATFKIWDCQNNKFVSLLETPSGRYIEDFVTTANGYFITPEMLNPGKYIIYETKAPQGYALNPEWKLPDNTADYGVEGKGGKAIELNKKMIGISETEEYDPTNVLIYTENMDNMPMTAKLLINKTGEVLTDASITSTEHGERYTPVYELRGLADVTYNIIAAQDIKSPDGTYTYVKKDEIVDTITTKKDGTAVTKALYLGEYRIEEIVTPIGYIKDENIGNVTLTNESQVAEAITTTKDLNNIRQKLKLTFKKEYAEINYSIAEDLETWAIFGVYANEDIKNVYGQVVINKDGLIDVIKVEGEEKDVTSTIDLPEGSYYVQELEASYPYTINTEKHEVNLEYVANNQEFVTVQMESVLNTYEKATVTLIKISSSTLGNVILNGNEVDEEERDERVEAIIDDVKGMTEEEIKQYLDEQEIDYVAGAVYSVFTDPGCDIPLLKKNENTGEYEAVTLITNNSGLIKIDLPIGKYFLKETYAPDRYQISDDVIELTLTREQKDSMVYAALVNDGLIHNFLTKTDIFTGEVVPNCTFEIKDENGKVLLHSITNENGEGHIPLDIFEDGKTYTYTEVDAPNIYNLNTEPHEFVASFDEEGQWNAEKLAVENYRKTINEVIIRKVDDETGKPLQGCKFSIILIDEEGNPVLNPNGENVYLVKEAVTGENGEYVIENPYYGIYQFIEVEAPEGYELKVDMEGMTFEINADSPETIIFEVTNTGDIAVYALAGIFGISLLGILYTIRKNKLARK